MIHAGWPLPKRPHDREVDTDALLAKFKAIWDDATEPPMLTAAEKAAGEWAELRAEDDAYEYGLLLAREMDARW